MWVCICEVCFYNVLYAILDTHFRLMNIWKYEAEHSSCI